GQLIAKAISDATGLPLRDVAAPGLKSEQSTGVAGEWNARLAMFAYTMAVREHCVRLVIEHGNLSNAKDKAIIDAPGFYDKAAAGAVRGIAQYMDSPYRASVLR